MGAFSHKFSIASSGETTDRNKEKFEGGGGAKMVKTFSITMPSMVSIVGRAPAVEEKVWFFRFLFVTLWYDEVCGNENAIKQCNFENNYGTVA